MRYIMNCRISDINKIHDDIVYENRIETKNYKEIQDEIDKLKEKCDKNASYDYDYYISKKLF